MPIFNLLGRPFPRLVEAFLISALITMTQGVMAGVRDGVPEKLGSIKGRGLVDAQVVGPGPMAGSERLYATYTYPQGTFDLVAIDPRTGGHQVFPGPVAGESGAKGLVLALDGNLYLGTYPKGHLLRFVPRTGEFTDLGRPAPQDGECWIWEMVEATDHRIYMATYPLAKLLRFDPATRKFEDLGRMSTSEKYCRYIAASQDGFVYLGIGLVKSQLVAYEIATGEHRPILPPNFQKPSVAPQVRLGVDGQVYASVPGQILRVKGWKADPITVAQSKPPVAQTRLKGDLSISVDIDGRLARKSLDAGTTASAKSQAQSKQPIEPVPHLAYDGKAQPSFRFTFGPDGNLYGSSVYPAYFFRMNPKNREFTNLGLLGPGEAYQLMPYKDRVAMALYAAFGGFNLMLFDPAKPFILEFDQEKAFQAGATRAINPLGVGLANSMGNWRPKAMIQGPDGKIYIGSVPGYGILGGSLLAWDADANKMKTFPISSELSVVSLCTTRGLIIGGTSREGGSGSQMTTKDGTLFIWNPTTEKIIYEAAPVPGQPLITNLVATPEGMVYGIAGPSEAFKFDTRSKVLTRLGKITGNCNIYSSADLGPDGNVYGLAQEGIYVIDTRNNTTRLLAPGPAKITAGFAIHDGYIFFACVADIYRYRLPGAGN